jgi:hypothetical protein
MLQVLTLHNGPGLNPGGTGHQSTRQLTGD